MVTASATAAAGRTPAAPKRPGTKPSGPAPVLIVGGGLAGLSCAIGLQQRGRPVRVLEAGDRPGGRVRTDRLGGFALDRGFQVLLTSYPEVQATLDLAELELGRFVPGALVWDGARLRTLVDPMRRPRALAATLTSRLATPGDAARVLRWRLRGRGGTPSDATAGPDDLDAAAALRAEGFSERLIERFWRPFLGGVLLDRDLGASRRSLDFLFRMFATGDAALPAGGMGALPARLAARLAPGVLQCNTRVAAIEPWAVRLASGERIEGSAVVVASDPTTAHRLLPGLEVPPMRRVGCLYFDAPAGSAPPVSRHLVLDGEGTGPVNHLCLPSEVAAGYAPAGHTLVSASVLSPALAESDDTIEVAARAQLRRWFGDRVARWRTLRLVRVEEALPAQTPGAFAARERPARVADGLFVAGDHRDLASIQGAMASGRRAAEAVAAALA